MSKERIKHKKSYKSHVLSCPVTSMISCGTEKKWCDTNHPRSLTDVSDWTLSAQSRTFLKKTSPVIEPLTNTRHWQQMAGRTIQETVFNLQWSVKHRMLPRQTQWSPSGPPSKSLISSTTWIYYNYVVDHISCFTSCPKLQPCWQMMSLCPCDNITDRQTTRMKGSHFNVTLKDSGGTFLWGWTSAIRYLTPYLAAVMLMWHISCWAFENQEQQNIFVLIHLKIKCTFNRSYRKTGNTCVFIYWI